MSRITLPITKLEPQASSFIANFHAETIKEVSLAIEENRVVVVGMAGNPYVIKARKALKSAGIKYKYLEYGSYMSEWKTRLAIKIWSGWPTFPQVFVEGKLVGGFQELSAELAAGKIKEVSASH